MESVPLTWEEVARVYGRKIYNFAYRLTGNSDDAADLVQEVLLRVRKGLAAYQPGSFEGFCSIGVNAGMIVRTGHDRVNYQADPAGRSS